MVAIGNTVDELIAAIASDRHSIAEHRMWANGMGLNDCANRLSTILRLTDSLLRDLRDDHGGPVESSYDWID